MFHDTIWFYSFSSFYEGPEFKTRWFYCVWTNQLQTLGFQSLQAVQKWEDRWLCMGTVLLQRHTISCLLRIKVTTKSPMVVKSELLRHLVLAWFSMSSKATKVQAEIRFYVAMLENHHRWFLRMMARERNQVPYFMCSSATIPGHPREQHAELYEKVFCWVIGSPARCHRDRWVNCFWTHGAVSFVFTPCFLLLSSKMYFGLQRKTLIFALPSLNSEWEQAKILTFQINQSWKCVTCR